MFLRASKTDLQALGEDVEGCADSVSKLREELKGLTGVDIMKNNKEFKSTFDIIKEISAVWQELDDVTQANVANLLGGKRNANVIQALMTNFKDAEAAMQTASNAAGSALKENEQYLDSIQGKLDIMKGKFQELAMQIVGSNLVKWVADVGNGMLDIVNGIQRVHALLPLVIGAVTAIVLSVAKLKAMAGETNILAMLGSGIGSMGPLAAGIMGVAAAAAALVGVINHFSQAQQKAIEQADQAAAAYADNETQYSRNMAALDALSDRYHELASKTELTAEEHQEYKNILQQIVDISPTVASGYDKEHDAIIRYADAIAGAKEELQKFHAEDQRSYFSEIDDRWGNWAKELTDSRSDFKKNAEVLLEDFYSDITSATVFKLSDSAGDALLEAVNSIFGFDYEGFTGYQEFRNWFDNATDEQIRYIAENIDNLVAQVVALKDDPRFEEAFTSGIIETWYSEIVSGLLTAASEVDAPKDKMADEIVKWLEYQEADISNATTKWARDLSSQPWYQVLIDAIPNLIDENSVNNSKIAVKEYVASLQELSNSAPVQNLYKLADALEQGKASEEEFTAAINDFETFAGFQFFDTDESILKGFVDYFRDILTGASDAKEEIDNVTSSITDLSTAVDKFTSGQKILETAKEEMKSGGLSAETIKSINDSLAEDEKLSDYLRLENGLIKLNTEAWDERSRSIIDNNISALKDEIAGYDAQIIDINGGIKNNPFADREEIAKVQEARTEAQLLLDVLTAISTGTDIEEIDRQIAEIDRRLYEMTEGAFSGLENPEGIAALEQEKARLEGVRDALSGVEEAATKTEDPLGDVMSKASKYADVLKSSMDGIDFSEWQQLRDVFGEDWESYMGPDGKSLDRVKMYTEVLDGLATNGAPEEIITAFKEMWAAIISGDDQVDTVKSNIETVISSVQELSSVTQTLREIDSGDIGVIDVFEKLLDLAKDNKDIDLSSILGEDGTINMDAARASLQSYADSLFTLEELKTIFPEITQAQADALREQILTYNEAEEAVKSFSDSLSNVSTAQGILSDMRSGEGDFLSIIKEIAPIADESGRSVGDFYSIIGDTVDWSTGIDIITEWAQSSIDSLEGVDDKSKEFLANYLKEQAEAVAASERTTRALSNISTVTQAGYSIGSGAQITYDQYKQLTDINKQYAYAVEYSNGVLTVNRQKFAEVTKAILENEKAQAEASAQAIIMSEKYQDCLKALEEGRDLGDDQAWFDDQNVAIAGFRMVTQEINNATDAYSRFLNTGNSDSEQFGAMTDAVKVIQDTLQNKDSGIYGKVGDAKFEAAWDLVVTPNIEFDTEEGKKAFERALQFLKDDVDAFDENLGTFKVDGFINSNNELVGNVEEMAETYGVNVKVIIDSLDQLNQYLSGDNKLKNADGTQLDVDALREEQIALGNIATNAETASDALKKLSDGDETTTESTGIGSLLSQITDVGSAIDELAIKDVTLDTSSAQSAAGKVSSALSNIMKQLNDLAVKTVNLKINVPKISLGSLFGGPGGVSGYGYSAAPGTHGAPGGKTLVGELGRKLFCAGIWRHMLSYLFNCWELLKIDHHNITMK